VHDDFAVEPIPGLPERPPDGERILWQGSPSWRALARRMFQWPLIALYFGILSIWSGVNAVEDGYGVGGVLISVFSLLGIGAGLLITLALLAFWIDRTTVYTITSERVVIRYGLALQMTVNFPFQVIRSATLKVFRNGTGNVNLDLMPGHGVAWLVLWPHVRPWRWLRTQPMLRCVPDARAAAEILAKALSAHATRDMGAAEAGRMDDEALRVSVRGDKERVPVAPASG